MLALTAMEEPTSFDAEALRIEKEKVLKATHLFGTPADSSVFAQYTEGWQGGTFVTSYKDEDGVSTLAAGRAYRSTCALASAWGGA